MAVPAQADAIGYDARIADAMNRVLEAERAAQSAIIECEQQQQVALEHARQQRRSILDRAHARVMALHARATRGLEQRTAEILAQQGGAPRASAEPGADNAHLKAAMERLVERLTSGAEEDDGDRG